MSIPLKHVKHVTHTHILKTSRDWYEHMKSAESFRVDKQMKMKERLVQRKKTLKIEKDLIATYSGLTERCPSSFAGEWAMVGIKLQKVHRSLLRPMTRVYQNTFVKQYQDLSLRLTTTHIYFGSAASIVIATNTSPRYAYGKIYAGRDVHGFTFFGVDGERYIPDKKSLKHVLKALRQVARKYCLKSSPVVNNFRPGKAIDDTLRGDLSGNVSFADCDAAGEGENDTPEFLASTTGPFPEPPAPPVVIKEGDSDDEDVNSFVRTIFATFIEPFMCFTVNENFYTALPESAFWEYRPEYIGPSTDNILSGEAYLGSSLKVDRSPYPLPPPEMVRTQEINGTARFKRGTKSVVVWNNDRDTYYDRKIEISWKKGWTPSLSASVNRNEDGDIEM